jgi:L-fuculose-phosphate aldolase
MHTLYYKKRPEMNAIIHCHAPKSSVFAVAGIPLNQPILAENIFTLGDIPVAKYYLPSSDYLANEVSAYFSSSDAVLMQNHGVILAAKDLRQAYYKMENT